MNNRGILVVISGMTAAGKGTICKELLNKNKNISYSVSMTTREPRSGEVNGVDYYFVSREQFKKTIESNGFLEYAIVHGKDYYGTPKLNINEKLNEGKDVLLEIDIQGALKIKEILPNSLFIFIMPPSIKVLKERLIKRGTETEDKMLDRFKSAYKELNAVTKYNYVVINDKLDVAVNKVMSIIEAEKCRVDRIEDEYLNNCEKEIHELLLDNKDFVNNI